MHYACQFAAAGRRRMLLFGPRSGLNDRSLGPNFMSCSTVGLPNNAYFDLVSPVMVFPVFESLG